MAGATETKTGTAGTGVTPPAAGSSPPAAAATPPAPGLQSVLAPPTSTQSGENAGSGTPAAGAQQTQNAGTEPKPTEGTAPADVEVKLPEGVKADEKVMATFKGLAKDLGLKSEGAQKLVDLFTSAQVEAAKAQTQEYVAQHEAWVQAGKADKEFGGAAYEQNLGLARKALAKFGTPELTKLVSEAAVGSHPELIRMLVRVGKAMGDDTIAGTVRSAPSAAQTEEARRRALYPTMYPKK